MDAMNIPIQMISVCDCDGRIRPIRFRFEDPDHCMRTVSIQEVVSEKEIQYVGIEAFAYVCRACMEGMQKMYELRYTVRTHKWVLFNILM